MDPNHQYNYQQSLLYLCKITNTKVLKILHFWYRRQTQPFFRCHQLTPTYFIDLKWIHKMESLLIMNLKHQLDQCLNVNFKIFNLSWS